MFNTAFGHCSLCKIEKPIPCIRDGYIICRDCNKNIQSDLDDFNTIECDRCFLPFSPLFIVEDFGLKMCKNCAPSGLCHKCHGAKPLPYVGDRGFLCKECAGK